MPIKNKYHQEIIRLIKEVSKLSTPDNIGFGIKYVGTNKLSYHLSSKDIQTTVKHFIKESKISTQDKFLLLDSLYENGTFDEILIAAKIIQESDDLRKNINFNKLNSWLDHVHGWAEVDVLCQMAFTDEDFLLDWDKWMNFLRELNQSDNIHKRRASLVLLTKPVRLSDDNRLSDLAFENIKNLQSEKHILITKAVSWLLRSLIKLHKNKVEDYLLHNSELLPKIAVREVTSKLNTGKKYINKKKLHGS